MGFEVVHWVKVSSPKLDNLTLTYGSHVIKGENWLPQTDL